MSNWKFCIRWVKISLGEYSGIEESKTFRGQRYNNDDNSVLNGHGTLTKAASKSQAISEKVSLT